MNKTRTAFSAALTRYGSHYPTKQDTTWAARADEFYRALEANGESPRWDSPLGRWASTQRRSIGRAAIGRESAEIAKLQRDDDRATVLDTMPGWEWDPKCARFVRRARELAQFVRAEHRLPTDDDRTRRAHHREAHLRQWLDNVDRALDAKPMTDQRSNWKRQVLAGSRRGVTPQLVHECP